MSRIDAVLDAMARHDVDVIVLGREANARVVTDTARLWLAGTRTFAPGCVVVRATGAVHVLANSDAVVPDGFPVERLFGITWNPERLFATLGAIPGVTDARRIAFDGMTPLLHTMFTAAAPGAEFVDGSAVLAELWRTPDPAAAGAVEASATVAAAGMDAIAAALRPGGRPRGLRGLAGAAFAALGVTIPAFEAVVAPIDGSSSTWLAPDRPLAAGEPVVVRVGALVTGWEASLARTFVVGDPAEVQPPPPGWDRLVSSCVAGATAGGLRAQQAIVYGAGRGVEPWDDDVELAPGLCCAVELAGEQGVHQDVLLVTGDAPVVLTRFG